MTSTSRLPLSIVPAQLSYLAIYNPKLGPTDETFEQQLVFYFSQTDADAKQAGKTGQAKRNAENANERLRRIGLAQGLIDFARTFSDGASVNSAETEKSRIILHELESEWWILASIDLTRIPTASPSVTAPTSTKTDKKLLPSATNDTSAIEYSSREVSPPILLTQQIVDAHAIFALHHGPSLSNLYARLPRERFCSVLDRYWGRFARTWDVLLHGNPAVDTLSGIKLASGGELGFGVGEEEWGSSERAVLEDITKQTEGLVDAVVARFGDEAVVDELPADLLPWVGSASVPSVDDGIIFGGVNGISRTSLQSVSLWMRHIYMYGENAYGVRDNPSRERRRRRRQRDVSGQAGGGHSQTNARSKSGERISSAEPSRDRAAKTTSLRPVLPQSTVSRDYATDLSTPGSETTINIPPPIVSAAEAALDAATKKADARKVDRQKEVASEDAGSTLGIPDQYLKYLTLGLSTYAKSGAKPQPPQLSRASTAGSVVSRPAGEHEISSLAVLDPMPDGNVLHAKVARQKRQENSGHFIVGLKGDVEHIPDNYEAELTEGSMHDEPDGPRTVLRTVYVDKLSHTESQTVDDSDVTVTATSAPSAARLRVVVYAHRPFLYCFLFEQRTSSLSYASFYRSLHRNLMPIHKQLLRSTQPSNVADRIQSVQIVRDMALGAGGEEAETSPVYDLMYDPARSTIHATVPNIPEPGSLAAEGILAQSHTKATSWSRLEALNVHSAMLNTLIESKKHSRDIERTCKTSRGWWVVWLKLPASDQTGDDEEVRTPDTIKHAAQAKDGQIAFVVRKASESTSANIKSSRNSSRAASGMWTTLASSLRTGESQAPLERITSLGSNGGIGFDARRYVESLLSLNR